MVQEVLTERSEDSMLLSEATFGSVQGRINPEERPERTAQEFIVMSSDRGERSPAENNQMYKEFKNRVKTAGYPFTEFIGSWVERDEETGEKRRVEEKSVIIYSDERPDIQGERIDLFELGKELSDEYKQEAFIFGELVNTRGGPSRIIKAFDSAGAAQEWGGPWSSIEAVKADENLWSRLRGGGTPFKFKEDLAEAEEVVEIEAPNSVIEAMRRVSENPGKKVKFVRRRNE